MEGKNTNLIVQFIHTVMPMARKLAALGVNVMPRQR